MADHQRPTWADAWVVAAVATGADEQALRAECADCIACLNDAERRYYACSPEAQEVATQTLAADVDADFVDWEQKPIRAATLAAAAEAWDAIKTRT